jgi:UDP-N-acetylglucosamine 2-epimerase (non-hydrolysing)
MKKIMVVFGTRPEAIKMAPLILQLKGNTNFEARVCVTAQHREMLDQVMGLFSIVPDYDLDLMTAEQDLSDLSANILSQLTPVLKVDSPDLVLVHGDTTTTLMATLSAFYCGIPVGHVEAGLRTGNLMAPWPEEANRKMVGVLASVHFAPTERAKQNLIAEGVHQDSIEVTGNTVIDALMLTLQKLDSEPPLVSDIEAQFSMLSKSRRIVLITGHRRESFGKGFDQICDAIDRLASTFDEVDFVYPVHMNPNVNSIVRSRLGGRENIHLLPPLDYLPFVYLMNRSDLVLTDSGGIQEEAPSLKKPVLVMRENTERPEAVEAGTVRLVGTSTESIVEAVEELLTDTVVYNKMAKAINPYGDGKSSIRIVRDLEQVNL